MQYIRIMEGKYANRVIDYERVKELIAYQEDFFLKNNEYDYPQTISLGLDGKESFYYVIDGQHRIESIRQLLINKPNLRGIHVIIELYLTKSDEELLERLRVINSYLCFRTKPVC